MGFFNSLTNLFGESTPKEDPAALLAREASRHTILVIDDDRDLLESCSEMLRNAGYNVLKSTNGVKGLNMLRYAPRDISAVLLDYDMPGLNGVDTLKFIQQIAPQVKVAALSGVDDMLLPAAFREKVDGFLAKPFEGGDLVQFVQQLICPVLQPVAVTANE